MTFFESLRKPFIVAVCVARDAEATHECVRQSVSAGADLVEVNLAQLTDSEASKLYVPQTIPYYVVCRRRKFMSAYGLDCTSLPEREDEARMRLASSMIDKGARALDMECDTFDAYNPQVPPTLPADLRELSVREIASQAQMEVIDSCHKRKAEVILSCHSGVALTASQTLSLAQVMAGIGGDVIKIVNSHDDAEYCAEGLKAIIGLRGILSSPFILTSVGPLSSVLRLAGCYVGNSYTFCRSEGPSSYYPDHPTIESVRNLWEMFPVSAITA